MLNSFGGLIKAFTIISWEIPMAKDHSIIIKSVVHKLQLSLLEGIQNEKQLSAAGSLMSRSDYQDVVTERSITKLCGYPLCQNLLPPEQPRKGRYHISLKEHKVYDLQETYMFCSSHCVISSRLFADSLREERCSLLNPMKIEEILKLFEVTSDEFQDCSGFSKLTIQEKTDTKAAEVSLEEWIGPSNAIEGHVPRRDHEAKVPRSKPHYKGYKTRPSHDKPNNGKTIIFNEMDFKNAIITQDEYSISKDLPGLSKMSSNTELKGLMGEAIPEDAEHQFAIMDAPTVSSQKDPEKKPTQSKGKKSRSIKQDTHTVPKVPQATCENGSFTSCTKLKKEPNAREGAQISPILSLQKDFEKKPSESQIRRSTIATKDELSVLEVPPALCANGMDASSTRGKNHSSAKGDGLLDNVLLKPSLKSSGAKKLNRCVTWADEKAGTLDKREDFKVIEMEDVEQLEKIKKGSDGMSIVDLESNDDIVRFASAEVCAEALTQAAEAAASEAAASEAAASEVSEVAVAGSVNEAGLIILPPPHEEVDEGKSQEEILMPEPEQKLPDKPGISRDGKLDSEDSWYDSPPDEFSLALSAFATMWNALFSWITSSSLAFIYGRDESVLEEYLSVNGREYPRVIKLTNGRSSEIKKLLSGYLARALPGLVADLRLPTPISTLEQAMERLLNTMSFLEALPSLKMRQWQVIALLFIDALSVCRIPSLMPHMTNRTLLINKVLDLAQVRLDEYDIMKELLTPLGRTPQFSTEYGG